MWTRTCTSTAGAVGLPCCQVPQQMRFILLWNQENSGRNYKLGAGQEKGLKIVALASKLCKHTDEKNIPVYCNFGLCVHISNINCIQFKRKKQKKNIFTSFKCDQQQNLPWRPSEKTPRCISAACWRLPAGNWLAYGSLVHHRHFWSAISTVAKVLLLMEKKIKKNTPHAYTASSNSFTSLTLQTSHKMSSFYTI